MTMPILPLEIVNIILMKAARNKGIDFAKIHHQINYPVMRKCLHAIQHEEHWLIDTTVTGNPFALDMYIDYVAAERIPPLV